MRWDGVGKEETQVPVELCCLSVFLAPLPSDRAEKTVRVKEASRCRLGHCRWVLFKGSFALLEHPRATGGSLSKWVLNTDSGRPEHPEAPVSYSEEEAQAPHSFLQRIHFLSSEDSSGSRKLTFPRTAVMSLACS